MGFFSDITGAIGDALGIAAAPETGGLSLAALAPSLIGGASTLLGGQATNSANAAMVAQQEQFSADMSGTAYQRSVGDLEKAGLNPMLAYSNGPASTPMGSTLTMQNPYPAAVSSAEAGLDASLSMKQQQLQNQLISSQIAKTDADAKTSTAQAALTASQVPKAELEQSGWSAVSSSVKPTLDKAADFGSEPSADKAKDILDFFSSPAY